VLIINTARGRLIDTAALLEALNAGIVGGAGLDVLGEEAALRTQTAHLISDQIVDHLRAETKVDAAQERTRQIDKLILIGRLLDRRNVIFTPHNAFNCVESIARINAATVANIQQFIARPDTHSADAAAPLPVGSAHASDELCLLATTPSAALVPLHLPLVPTLTNQPIP
jgi:lactate dehydrogenase-like 2-hydroxyacid dehydrogenase